MNVFQYIERYRQSNSNQTYGDLMSGNKAKFENTLDMNEQQAYDILKNSDKQRLINESRKQPNNISKTSPGQTYISGIGEITQVM